MIRAPDPPNTLVADRASIRTSARGFRDRIGRPPPHSADVPSGSPSETWNDDLRYSTDHAGTQGAGRRPSVSNDLDGVPIRRAAQCGTVRVTLGHADPLGGLLARSRGPRRDGREPPGSVLRLGATRQRTGSARRVDRLCAQLYRPRNHGDAEADRAGVRHRDTGGDRRDRRRQ